MFKLASLVLVGVLSTPALLAQQSQATGVAPAFEVASVKPNKSGTIARGGIIQRSRFVRSNVTLSELIQMAYSRRAFDHREIVGGPSWMNADRFDIEAKIDERVAGDLKVLYLTDGQGNPPQMNLMVRTLLAERFKLEIHSETRELPVYALVISQGDRRLGPRLRRSAVDCDAVLAEMANTGKPATRQDPLKGPPCSFGPRPGRLEGNSVTMSQLADILPLMNRPVLDRTGLSGGFDLILEWTPEQQPSSLADGGGTSDRPLNDGVSIFTALQEQLGLKLESTRGPVEVLIIDRAEQPTPD